MAPVYARVTNCIVARIGKESGGLCALTGAASSGGALKAVCSRILDDSRWQSVPHLAFVLKEDGSESILAAFGVFGETEFERLKSLSAQIGRVDQNARYIDYRQAEQDCEILAARLKERFGRRELRSFSFYPVPRGGVIVYGMLSYALDLPATGDNSSIAADAPVMFVDDCAISGMRFGQMLGRFPGRRVIFAPLYSHPDLRRAICDREPRVIDCVSAHDLADLAPELYGEGYAGWHAVWSQRLGKEVYWTGQPEYLCFAWNEPESSFWNSATDKLEPGWRLVPRNRCLRHRSVDGPPHRDTDTPLLQVLPKAAGPIKPANGTIYARMPDDTVALAALPGSECYILEGTAAAMWFALVEHGAVEPAAASLAGRYEVEAERLEADMKRFVENLRDQGLVADS